LTNIIYNVIALILVIELVTELRNSIRVQMLVSPEGGRSFEAIITQKGDEKPTRMATGTLKGLGEALADLRIAKDTIFELPLGSRTNRRASRCIPKKKSVEKYCLKTLCSLISKYQKLNIDLGANSEFTPSFL
jgi:hypothetical protein